MEDFADEFINFRAHGPDPIALAYDEWCSRLALSLLLHREVFEEVAKSPMTSLADALNRKG